MLVLFRFLYITALNCRSEQCSLVQKDEDQLSEEVNVGIKMSLRCKNNDEVFRHGEKVLKTTCVQIKAVARWSREPGSCKGKSFSVY